MSGFFDDIKAYVRFSDADTEALRRFHAVASPHFGAIADRFYERILEHPRARDAIRGGDEQVERLKHTLVDWMDSGLRGPHDEAFHERRARIGRMHVQIRLPQQYMFTAMNVIRLDCRRIAHEHHADDPASLGAVSDALDRLFDLELAIMLQSYTADSDMRLQRQERLATIGQLAGSIAHDLRNPLGVVQSSLYILRKRLRGDERALRHLDKIGRQVDVSNTIVSDLLEMARGHPPKRVPVDVAELFGDVVTSTRIPAEVSVRREVGEGLDLRADYGLLRQAVTNLVANAVLALEPGGGAVELRALADEDVVVIEVSDDGPGFDPAVLPTVFEPLVTTRAKGTGLGLALVKNIAHRHGGTVEAGNHRGGGACVRMRIPATGTDETSGES